MADNAHQPNTLAAMPAPKLWPLLSATGVGAGVGSGLLMQLLRSVQHVAFHYSSGDFLDGVKQSSSIRRMVVLLLAGIVTAVGLYLLRRFTRAGADPSAAVWNKNGDLPVAASFCRAVLSITIVGMGTALGREAALKQAGAAVAAKLSFGGRLNGAVPVERCTGWPFYADHELRSSAGAATGQLWSHVSPGCDKRSLHPSARARCWLRRLRHHSHP